MAQDPKPLMPRVRLDKEMIDAIGGEDDLIYQEYKELCIRFCFFESRGPSFFTVVLFCSAFLCLRQHLPVFFRVLLLLPTADPPIPNLGCTIGKKHGHTNIRPFLVFATQSTWSAN